MYITIAQLQAAYKVIYGHAASDVHCLRAAFYFNVPYDEVTKEQRAEGKQLNQQGEYRATTINTISMLRPQFAKMHNRNIAKV